MSLPKSGEEIDKSEQGKENLKSLLSRGEFKTKKSAISYTATIHRLYHLVGSTRINATGGIRSGCNFCTELIVLINTHFETLNT